MSGLENSHRDRSRANLRTSVGRVAVVGGGCDIGSAATAAVSECAVRNWSWPSALVGDRYSARARGSRASASMIGNWKASDLPDAVPVLITT